MRKIIAWFLAFLLTGTLILFGICFAGRQLIIPAMGEEGAAVNESVIREEKELARERITALAELYGFSAEPVIETVNEETLRDLNKQASLWWSSVLKDGKAGKELRWDTKELEKILEADPAAQENPEEAGYFASTVAAEVHKSIVNMVLPMRQIVISLGLQEAGKRADLVNLIEFFLGTPWTMLALSVLIAGLIALTAGRPLRRALRYIGSALGAAAIVTLTLTVLYMRAGILPMIREASAGLTVQYRSLVSGTMVQAILLTAIMIAGCAVCLFAAREKKA